MSRSGIEAKLPWRRVPKAVRQQVEDALGAPVRRAMRIWGGYSPAPTFRLALADGRRAFFKATNGSSNEFSTRALRMEERVYRELNHLLERWMPKHYATISYADWYGLVLEDLGPKSVPPWRPVLAKGIAHALAEFHQATLGVQLPEWLARPQEYLASEQWQRVRDETEDFHKLAHWAGDGAGEAVAWLQRVSPLVNAMMQEPVLASEPHALVHMDLRSDNLRFSRGRLYLFDWPAVRVGRPEWDFVAFAQSVTVEDGAAPEQMLAWYAEKVPVEPAAVDSSIAWWLTFFAMRAWRDEVAELPRLRRFQRQQFAVLAQWAAQRWALPRPTWAPGFWA